jgi:hypothetical protein
MELRAYIQRELSRGDVNRQNKQMGRHVKFEIAVPESTRQLLRIRPGRATRNLTGRPFVPEITIQ